jgi:hypothetical protein
MSIQYHINNGTPGRLDVDGQFPTLGSLRTVIKLAILLFIYFAASPAESADLKRRALVIANASYIHTTALKNPLHDAALIADKLDDLGFKVWVEHDLDAKQFSDVIQKFSADLDKETEALVYYAGHGLQFRGENFLVGVDAGLKGQAALQFETFKLNTILELIERRALVTLLFWDACRNNPLADELMRSVGPLASFDESGLVRGGAAPLPPRRGDTLIVFSAEPGKRALDGEGELSPFAEALSHHITSALEIEHMLKHVTADVLEHTRNFQRPERLSQLTRDFYFRREGTAELDYQKQLQTLLPQLAAVQREPIARKQFKIIGSDDLAALRKSTTAPAPQSSITRGQEPSYPDGAQSANGSTITSHFALADPSGGDVVIAVDRAGSTIVRKLRISPNGKLLALGDEEGLVRIVRLENFEVIATIRAHNKRISDLDFSPDSRTLLSAGRDGLLRFWDLENIRPAPFRELRAPASIPYSARLNPSLPNRFVVMGGREGRVIAWDLKRNQIITNNQFHHGPVHSVAYRPHGGGTYLSGGGDGELKLRLPEGQRLSFHTHDGVMFQASYSATGKLVYTVGADRLAKIWDAGSGRQLTSMKGHLKYVLTADMSPDEQMLVTGGGDKALNLWDVNSGRLIGRMQGHTSDIESVAFSPNGRFIVSAGEDKSVVIWSVDNREELARMFFQKSGEKYAGVTFENQAFGERNSGLLSVYVDGKQLSAIEADRVVRYIGHGIAILEP